MKNIEYLEQFFRKHNLSGKVKVKYSSRVPLDDYMTNIVFENGDVININDIIFDIESEFPNDVVDQWLVAKKESGVSLMNWIQSDTKYFPSNIDTKSVEDFQNEMAILANEVKENIDKIFKLDIDDIDTGNSDLE